MATNPKLGRLKMLADAAGRHLLLGLESCLMSREHGETEVEGSLHCLRRDAVYEAIHDEKRRYLRLSIGHALRANWLAGDYDAYSDHLSQSHRTTMETVERLEAGLYSTGQHAPGRT